MTLSKKVQQIRDALKTVNGLNIYHYWRPNMVPPFVVWAETGEADSFHSDDHKTEQGIRGTADYYTKTEYDANIDAIQTALDSVGAFRLDAVEYEDETNLIHYSWIWEVR